MDSECLSNNGGVAAEEKAVREACEGRHIFEVVWILDINGAELSDEEDERGNDKTPRAGCVEAFDHKIGAGPCDSQIDCAGMCLPSG